MCTLRAHTLVPADQRSRNACVLLLFRIPEVWRSAIIIARLCGRSCIPLPRSSSNQSSVNSLCQLALFVFFHPINSGMRRLNGRPKCVHPKYNYHYVPEILGRFGIFNIKPKTIHKYREKRSIREAGFDCTMSLLFLALCPAWRSAPSLPRRLARGGGRAPPPPCNSRGATA